MDVDAQAAGSGVRGMGWVGSWSTEVPLNLPSSRGTRTAVRADAVLQAPEAGLPVLFVEVDNCTEPPEMLAAKFEKYRTYFRLCAAIVDRLTFGGNLIQTGTDSYRLALTQARAAAQNAAG